MIRPIDIRLNAAHPELKLPESVTYTGSPSTVLIRGVPPNYGRWAITAVFVAATFPDGSTTTRAAVQSANGVWVATLPATATSGRTTDGFRVIADGIDENGEAATGYILAVADFAVASLGVTPAPQPGETSWQMLYFDAVPGTLRKGDVAKVDGVLKLYNGTAWEAFAGDIPAPSTATPAMDGTGAAGSSTAYARGDHVHPTDTSRMAATATGADIPVSGTDSRTISNALNFKVGTSNGIASQLGNLLAASVSGRWILRVHYNEAVYNQKATLQFVKLSNDPSQPDQVLASITLPATDAGTLAMVNDIPVVTAPSTEASASDKAADAKATGDALAGKLDKSGGGIAKIEWVDSGQSTATLLITFANGKALAFDYDGYSSDTVATRLWVAAQGFVNRLTSYFTAGNLAQLTQDGGIEDAGWTAGDLARYALTTKTINNGAVSLDDRASNSVTVSATLSPNTLTINFPTAPTGKLRDFAMRLNIAAGVTAPEIAWPQGVTLENNGGEVPEIADGGTGGSSTILYFSETENDGTTAKFLVKGETLTAIAQA